MMVFVYVVRKGLLEKGSSRFAMKPLLEPLPSEAVIDIKPEMDDDLIGEELLETGAHHARRRSGASRPTAEIYRPGQSRLTHPSEDAYRPSEGSSHIRQQDYRSSRSSRSSKVLGVGSAWTWGCGLS